MKARGQTYQERMNEWTPLKLLVNRDANQTYTYLAIATIEFARLLESAFNSDRLEVASFEATEGISGVVLTHRKTEK